MTENLPPSNITLSNNSIAENSPVGTTIGTLSATDPEGQPLTYRLVDSGGGLVQLDGNRVQLAKPVSYEELQGKTFQIEVSDGVNKVLKKFFVSIEDVDEPPHLVWMGGAEVPEDMKVGTVFDYVSGVDPEDSVLTFKLIDDAGGTFKLVGANAIQLAKPVDFEKSPTKTVTFEVSDGKFTVVKSFTINIADVNEAPSALTLSNSRVAETAAVDTLIGTFSAVDPEGDPVDYWLKDSAGGTFWIVDNKLYLNDTLNYETQQSYSITVVVSNASGSFTKNFVISVTDVLETIVGNSSSQTLNGGIGADKILAGGGNDTLFGNDGDDLLYGESGNDTILGGAGKDRLDGGTGNDTASYASATVGVKASLSSKSTNTNDAAGDTYFGIENLTGTRFADVLGGNAYVNILTGGEGSDILIGGAGGDKLYGGTGNDAASYATAATGVIANLGRPSSNTGDAKGDTYSAVESLIGSNFADQLYGNGGANRLSGGTGDDIIGAGSGNDWIYGGSGADRLVGGMGADRFVFKALSESAGAKVDSILDFVPNEQDRIDLSAIDANTKTSGNQAFSFIGTAAFKGTAGELRYEKLSSDTFIYADVNGDRIADLKIHLDDAVTLAGNYFLL
ncbi:M10 family metallopeptidase C-terminal domain-containing protein [Sinorhizobium arboris]|uniref:M10 family metallopeptidase C-terminal domain-containing protein n=1 Tax=Sinorhizobium arboris TaxID=76745 RepID=UPI001F222383|nr:calcium-binding protein [Sinorhizobium arboris]